MSNTIRFNLLHCSNTRIEVSVSGSETARPIFPRRQPVAFFRRTVDTNSFLSIVRVASIAHRPPVYTHARLLSFTLVHALLDLPLAHARWRAEATLSSNQQKPTTTFYRLALFPPKKRKKKKKKERCCYSILQLLDFLIPGNNRENISPPPCSSFVPLPRRTPRRLATVYQLAVSRFSFYTFFFPPFETTLLAAYIIIPSSIVLFIILSLIETASLAGVVFGYGQGVS